MNDIQFTKSQQSGLDQLLAGQNCFVTGLAGTGKSKLVEHYTSNYCNDKKILKCAYTAASVSLLTKDKDSDLVGTIHSIFHIHKDILSRFDRCSFMDAWKIYSQYDIVIIDEISMVRIDIFNYIIKSIYRANKFRQTPIQVIAVGDFHQLPPIMSDNIRQKLYKLYKTDTCYAFESKYWDDLNFQNIYLDEDIRFKDDKSLSTNLNRLVTGIDTNLALDYFNKQVDPTIKPSKDIVELYATNAEVNKINRYCLKQLPGKTVSIHAYFDNEVRSAIHSGRLTNKDLPCPRLLELKPGAQVMFIRNDKIVDNKQRFINGDLAEVISCEDEQVVVKLAKNGKLVHLHKHNCSYPINKPAKSLGGLIIQDEYGGLYNQYPLVLAYAITIYKAQGKTFDKVHFNPGMGDNLSPGAVYVALSRVRSIQDLHLYTPLYEYMIKFDRVVIEFYKKLFN